MPTAAELAGTNAPEGIDGYYLTDALLNKPVEIERELYWEFHELVFKQNLIKSFELV